MTTHSPLLSPRPCPLCGSPGRRKTFPFETVFNGTTFSYLRCEGCNSTFVDPVPSADDFAKMYSRGNYHDHHYSELRLERYDDSIKYLRQHCFGSKTLLDFGCGNAAFIIGAEAAEFHCTGIEFEASAIESARVRSGLEVMSLEDALSAGRRFDVIHMGDVLEHLAEPKATISKLRGLLCDGGVFFIEGPLENNPSLVYFVARALKSFRRLLGKSSPGQTAPTHLIRVNARAQEEFFTRQLGYRCLNFSVYETGWPYIAKTHSRSLGTAVKSLVGHGAILMSKFGKVGGRSIFGNRFRSIFRP